MAVIVWVISLAPSSAAAVENMSLSREGKTRFKLNYRYKLLNLHNEARPGCHRTTTEHFIESDNIVLPYSKQESTEYINFYIILMDSQHRLTREYCCDYLH